MPGQEDVIIRILTDTKGSAAGVKQSEAALAKLGKQSELTGRQVYYAGMMVGQLGRTARLAGAAMLASVVGMIKAWSDFQQQMINTQSVAGATADELEKLTQTALKMAGTTRFSAQEVAQAMYYLASAGYTATEILSAIAAVTDLAAGTLSDLQTASQYVATTLAAFSLSADDATRVADVFAASISSSQATLERLGGALAYIGPIAEEMGLTIEDTVAALSALYDVGILGSKAGRALRMALSKLVDVTPKAKVELMKYGLTVTDLNPQLYSFAQILEKLKKANVDAALTFELFGRRAAPAMMTLIGLGETGFETYLGKVSETGKAHELAELQLDTLQSTMKRMRDAVIAAGATLGQTAEGPVRFFADSIRKLAEFIETSGPSFKTFIVTLTALGGAVGVLGGQFGIMLGVFISASIQLAHFNMMLAAAGQATITLGGVVKKVAGLFLNWKVVVAGLIIAVIGFAARAKDAIQKLGKDIADSQKQLIDQSIKTTQKVVEGFKLVKKAAEGYPATIREAIEMEKAFRMASLAAKESIKFDWENMGTRTLELQRQLYFNLIALADEYQTRIRENQALWYEEFLMQQENIGTVVYDRTAKELEAERLASEEEIRLLKERFESEKTTSEEREKLKAKLKKADDKRKDIILKEDQNRDKIRAQSFKTWADFVGGTTSNLGILAQAVGAEWALSWITNISTMLSSFIALQIAIAKIGYIMSLAKKDIIGAALYSAAMTTTIIAGAAAAIQMGLAIASIVRGTKAVKYEAVTMPEFEVKAGEKPKMTFQEFQHGGITKARGLAMLDANEVVMPLQRALGERPGAGGLGGVTINLNIEGGAFESEETWRKITREGILPALREIGLTESTPDVFSFE